MKYKDVFLYKVIRPIIWFLFRIIYTPKYKGLENIPASGRVVLAGNHTSNLDSVFLISATKRNIHFLAKDELFHGFKKVLFNNLGLIPVNRSIHDHGALDNAIKYLEHDLVIGIFPEGTTRKGDNYLKPFKFGAVKMASVTNSKIVPFVITGKYRLWGRKLTIEFLKPITISSDLEKENEKLYNIINDKIDYKE